MTRRNFNNLISDPLTRKKRTAANNVFVLDFLGQEIFTHHSILQQGMGLSRSAVHRLLTRMARDGLVRKEVLKRDFGGDLPLWGLTPEGALLGNAPENYFQPGKISLTSVNHIIKLQELRVRAMYDGWVDWQNDRQIMSRLQASDTRWPKIPDAIADKGGRKVAVELELSVKTLKRYRGIVGEYLLMVGRMGLFSEVHYVCPNGVADRLRKLFLEVGYVVHQGRRYQLTEKHHSLFSFFDFDEWLF